MANPAEKVAPNAATPRATGVLPSQVLRELVRGGEISAETDIAPDQVQPASLDLRLGAVAYRVKASFLPGPDLAIFAMKRSMSDCCFIRPDKFVGDLTSTDRQLAC